MPTTFDPTTATLAGVLLIPLIIALVQALKGIFPTVPNQAWLGFAMLFGIVGQAGARVAAEGPPGTVGGWLALGVQGLMVGLAAAKTYDESLGRRGAITSQEVSEWTTDLPGGAYLSGRVEQAEGVIRPPYLVGGASLKLNGEPLRHNLELGPNTTHALEVGAAPGSPYLVLRADELTTVDIEALTGQVAARIAQQGAQA